MWVVDVLLLAGVVSLGYGTQRALLGDPDPLLPFGISLPLGAGSLTFLLFLISWAGMPLTVGTVAGGWLALMVGVLLAAGNQPLFPSRVKAAFRSIHSLQWGLILALALVVGSAAIIGVGRGYSTFDAAVGWSLKGYGMFHDRSVLSAAEWGLWGTAYPLNLPLQIGLFYAISSDTHTLSKLLFPLLLLSLLFLCLWFWRRNGVGLWVGLAGMLFLATIRLVYYHATIGYANLPFASYFVGGSLLALEGVFEDEPRLRTLGGVLLALATWTRAEGIGYVGLAILVMLSIWGVFQGWKRLPVRWIAPVVIVFLPWYLFARPGIQASHLGTATSGVLPRMMEGQFNLFQLYLVPRLFLERALSPTNMGLFVQVTALLLVAGLIRHRFWPYAKMLALLLVSAASALIPILLFYVRSFTRLDEFRELLIRSFDRAFLPATFMLVVLGVWMAAGPKLLAPAGGLERAEAGQNVQ